MGRGYGGPVPQEGDSMRHLDSRKCRMCGHYESSHGWRSMRFLCLVWGCHCRD